MDEPPGVTFRADTNLVLVRFQVVARKNDFVADLRPDEITLRVDGVPQEIALFEGGKLYARATNIEIHLVFDCSGSVQRAGMLNPHAFTANLLDEFQNVRVAIWGFSGKSLVYFTAPTRDSARLNAAMEAVRRMDPGATPLYRSLTEIAGRVAKAGGESIRMIVVVSDGLDDSAKGDVERAARSAGIGVFPVLVNEGAQVIPPQYLGSPALQGMQERANAQHSAFTGLADATGGRAFEFQGQSPNDLLDQILKRMAAEIRYDYVVGYYAPSTVKRGSHQVQVALKNPSRGRVVGGARDVQQ